jgi:hypothetical protein
MREYTTRPLVGLNAIDCFRLALEKIAMRDRMMGELQEPKAAQIAREALATFLVDDETCPPAQD